MKKENQRNEEKAIRFIEKIEGKKCDDYHRKKKIGYDIKIGNKFIEVKARSTKKPTSLDYTKEIFNFANNPKNNFWLYYVYNVSKKPKLKKYSRKEFIKKSHKEIHYRFDPNKKCHL